MATMTITNATALVGGRRSFCNLRLTDGKIQGVLPAGDTYGKTFDAKGAVVAPAFFDVHTHGAVGVNFNSADANAIKQVCDFFASQGVAHFLATVMADTEENMLRAVTAIARARQTLHCDQIDGIHLEGPFLSPDYAGCLPVELLQPANPMLLHRLQTASGGLIRVVTLSPELKDVEPLVRSLSEEGIRVALGHSGADYETTLRCIEAGAVCATHLFNGMAPLDHHRPGIVAAALEQDIFCEIICDGKHLHPGIVRLILKAKGAKRPIGVTDSMAAAGLGDGLYPLAGGTAVVQGGESRMLGSGVRAGSLLTMPQALKCLMTFTGLPLEQAIVFFTENPARYRGLFGSTGSIEIGKDADLMVLDQNLRVTHTFLGGKLIFEQRS